MNHNRSKSKGNISLLVIAGLVTSTIAGAYFYLDRQADAHVNASMASLVDEAQSQGLTLSYSAADASPLSQVVEITDFIITGHEQEPDIQLGNVVIKGFSWQDLNNNQNQLPLEMSVDITKGQLHLKQSMIETNTDIQTLVRILGDTIPFSTQISYQIQPIQKQLHLSLTQELEDHLIFDGKVTLGNMNWLMEMDSQQTHMPAQAMAEAMNSTLKGLSINYTNMGLIEKIRADISLQTGKTTEQLTEESIAQMKQLQATSAQHWGPIFTPLIDEMIKFSAAPKQLTLNITPVQPLTGQDFMMAFIGGEAGLIKLLEDAQIRLTAN